MRYTEYTARHTVRFTEYTSRCTEYTARYTCIRYPISMDRADCTIYRVHCTMYRVHWTMYRVHCTMHSVHMLKSVILMQFCANINFSQIFADRNWSIILSNWICFPYVDTAYTVSGHAVYRVLSQRILCVGTPNTVWRHRDLETNASKTIKINFACL